MNRNVYYDLTLSKLAHRFKYTRDFIAHYMYMVFFLFEYPYIAYAIFLWVLPSIMGRSHTPKIGPRWFDVSEVFISSIPTKVALLCISSFHPLPFFLARSRIFLGSIMLFLIWRLFVWVGIEQMSINHLVGCIGLL